MSNTIKIIKDLLGLSRKRNLVYYDEDDSKDDIAKDSSEEEEDDSPKRVVIVSGYFSPVHEGHIEYFRMAKEFAGEDGIVYAIVNSDAQSILKKNYSFVPENDRLAVVGSCRYIEKAILSIDTDRSVCATIRMICYMAKKGSTFYMPTHFANGGDVTATAKCPEEPICKANNVELVYGLGDKIQSSSWIIEDSVKKAYEEMCGKIAVAKAVAKASVNTVKNNNKKVVKVAKPAKVAKVAKPVDDEDSDPSYKYTPPSKQQKIEMYETDLNEYYANVDVYEDDIDE